MVLNKQRNKEEGGLNRRDPALAVSPHSGRGSKFSQQVETLQTLLMPALCQALDRGGCGLL